METVATTTSSTEREESARKKARLTPAADTGGRLILAPMVRACSLPFRVLCRELGAAATYTAEVIDVKLCGGASQRRTKCGGRVEEWVFGKDKSCTFETLVPELRACGKSPDTPVIFQVGSASPEKAAEACRQVVGSVDGLDLNLGCAEFFSTQGGMGSALLEKPDAVREIVHRLVREFGHTTEVSAKIRLLGTPAETAEFVRTALCAAGCRTVAVHARHVWEDRYTAPHWDELKALRETLEPDRVHLIANGGVKTRDDVAAIRRATGIPDVMVGKGALANPSSVFALETTPPTELIERFLKLVKQTKQNKQTNKQTNKKKQYKHSAIFFCYVLRDVHCSHHSLFFTFVSFLSLSFTPFFVNKQQTTAVCRLRKCAWNNKVLHPSNA